MKYSILDKVISFKWFLSDHPDVQPLQLNDKNILEIPLPIRGVRNLILNVEYLTFGSKGFVTKVIPRSNTPIGESRAEKINEAINQLFGKYTIEPSQIEGLYLPGTRSFIPRIKSVEISPLFSCNHPTGSDMNMFRYKDTILERIDLRHRPSPDFVDDEDRGYRIVRKVTNYEEEHGFLFLWRTPRGYVPICEAKELNSILPNLRIHDPVVMELPPLFPVGSQVVNSRNVIHNVVEHQGRDMILVEKDFPIMSLAIRVKMSDLWKLVSE